MKIESVKFVKGVTGSDSILEDGIPQVAFIGRSNVGKSSVINSLTGMGVARTSAVPGFTQQINLFLLNGLIYLVDLPGYGYAKVDPKKKNKIRAMINWYFFDSDCEQKKVILIIDANVGPTQIDLETLYSLEDKGKNIVVVANKIDKIKKTEYPKKWQEIEELIGSHKIIPYSAVSKQGRDELLEEIFN
ncbi:MAG: ribosome biogenesis GTP-binding protein YihA/YsxC [Candidatus Pacebacteria bacterium]|nr:ribosome biogenesis GTP-binding protein YihA/YsxC [Candidatus Paceibacterota bacterium]